jgi:predicted nuclease of restriction endonuclease-like RecB superfamily
LLTADLVHVRRRGDHLLVVPLGEADRPRARELASTVLDMVRAHVGLSRGALLEAWNQVALSPSEARLGRALFKLATDACEFDEGTPLDPIELRRELFTQAAQFRRSGADEFDRELQIRTIAEQRGVEAEAIEAALYADLPTAHLLRKADLPSADGLLAEHDLAQHQAVLLRAVHLQARVFCTAASTYRALFRKLKFHRLIYSIAKLDRGKGYAISIDGPFSLFEQTTKYGVQLALVLPALMECDVWDLGAELRWGKDRRPLRYHVRGSCTGSPTAQTPYSDEVGALLSALRSTTTDWEVALADDILDLPGIGLCVPDLVFVQRQTAKKVFLEVLGFWSRDAVWKRIELAQAGLPHPIVFAVSRHMRVSEEALGGETPAALYTYARAMNAQAVLERVEAVADR